MRTPRSPRRQLLFVQGPPGAGKTGRGEGRDRLDEGGQRVGINSLKPQGDRQSAAGIETEQSERGSRFAVARSRPLETTTRGTRAIRRSGDRGAICSTRSFSRRGHVVALRARRLHGFWTRSSSTRRAGRARRCRRRRTRSPQLVCWATETSCHRFARVRADEAKASVLGHLLATRRRVRRPRIFLERTWRLAGAHGVHLRGVLRAGSSARGRARGSRPRREWCVFRPVSTRRTGSSRRGGVVVGGRSEAARHGYTDENGMRTWASTDVSS